MAPHSLSRPRCESRRKRFRTVHFPGVYLATSSHSIGAATGAHIWADRFEGELEDVFEFQDRIAEIVAGAPEPRLIKAETERS